MGGVGLRTRQSIVITMAGGAMISQDSPCINLRVLCLWTEGHEPFSQISMNPRPRLVIFFGPISSTGSLPLNTITSLNPGTRAISLPEFLRYASIPALVSALNATRTRLIALRPAIDTTFAYDHIYPWRVFAVLAPEKVLSDMIEAMLGAVYVDTNDDLKVCETLLRRFGILGWVEITLKSDKANI